MRPFFGLADFFPRSRPTVNMALKSDHGPNKLGIIDYLLFTKLFTVRRRPVQ